MAEDVGLQSPALECFGGGYRYKWITRLTFSGSNSKSGTLAIYLGTLYYMTSLHVSSVPHGLVLPRILISLLAGHASQLAPLAAALVQSLAMAICCSSDALKRGPSGEKVRHETRHPSSARVSAPATLPA